MATSFGRPAAIGTIISAVLVGAGVLVWLTAPGGAASFGWFAYAPLADGTFAFPNVLFGQRLLAAGLVAMGLIIAGVALGFWWGRRVGRRC